MRWDYTKFAPGHFDFVAAGVPCQEYSIAKTTAPRNLEYADKVVKRTLEIISYLAPTMWWIENPRSGLLKHRNLMNNFAHVDVDYCQFADWGYKKPTRVWGSAQLAHLPNQLCSQSCSQRQPDGKHKLRLGGKEMKVGTWLKGRMPESLIIFLLSSEPSFGVKFPEKATSANVGDRQVVTPSYHNEVLEEPKKHSSSHRWVPKSTLSTKIAPGSPAWCQERVGSGAIAAAASGPYPPSTTTLPGGHAWCREGVERGVTTTASASSTISVKTFSGSPVWCQEKAETGSKTVVTKRKVVVNEILATPTTPTGESQPTVQTAHMYRVKKQEAQNLQLMLHMEAELEDGTLKEIQVLVDTGAQANLVRTSLIPTKFLRRARDPLQLLSANGEVIPGGDRETTLRIYFEKVPKEIQDQKPRHVTGVFHVANIAVDAILSYPWLRDAKIGIFPHLDSLAIPHHEQTLLQPLPVSNGKVVPPSHPSTRKVHQVSKVSKPKTKRSDYWITERYQVRPEMVQHILEELGETPTLDLFADSQTHVFPRWFGEGGELPDAFGTSWCAQEVGTTWANPPFSVLEQVVHKIVEDQARTVVVCPHWKQWKWWKAAQPLIEKQMFIPKNTKVFQSPERDKVPPTKWGVWAYVLNGMLAKESWSKLWKKTKAEKIKPKACVYMFTVRPTSEPEEARIEDVRQKIFKDFEGTVLTSQVPHNPPKRGPYGEAKILLKEGAIPVRQKVFGVHGERALAHKKVTQEWLDNGYLELAEESEWLSMTFPVPKKNPGEWRGVVDMRGPNEHTRTSNYPLPVIERLLVIMGAKQIFSILDLKQAFHQQPLEKSSRPITACWTPLGVFQWKVNVMGLKNAPQQFQQMIDWVLSPVKDFAVAYIDDILVGTRVEEGGDLIAQHEKDVRKVLEQLREHKLIVDPKKCTLFTREVEFCGHVLFNGTRRPMPKKLSAIQNWEAPKNVTQMRGFLGFTNYYAIYIPGYADLAAPLQEKLKLPRGEGKAGSKKAISWTPEDQQAFDKIKEVLCGSLSLNRMDPDRPFVLRTDASKYAVGAVLEQLPTENRVPTTQDVLEKKTVPVGFMSRKLTVGQRLWTPRELETYAIILALQKWADIIGSQPITVITDHKSLEAWYHEDLDTLGAPAARRLRWHQFFSRFDITVVYLPGKTNDIADALSRWAYPASQAFKDVSKHGSLQDKIEMEIFEEQEKFEERGCLVVTRSGKQTAQQENETPSKSPEVSVPCQVSEQAQAPTSPKSKPATSQGFQVQPTPAGLQSESSPPPAQTSQPQQVTSPKMSYIIDPAGNMFPIEPVSAHEGVEEDGNLAGTATPGNEIISTPEENSSNIGDMPSIEALDGSRDSADSSPTVEEEIPQEAGQPLVATPALDEQSVDDMDWGKAYKSCPKWKQAWEDIEAAKVDKTKSWPSGFQLNAGKLLLHQKIAVPTSLQQSLVWQYHNFLGHVGFERLWGHMERRLTWADESNARKLAKLVSQQCETCQACQPPLTLKTRIKPTPIPPHVMSHVAIDLFRMPPVEFEGQKFDTLIACVDRHSGWIVAIPTQNLGLTGSKVAKLMLQHFWRPFGIPSVITSDLGSHFVGSWWQTLCAHLGIRVAYGHAYHHQSNGRAERAGLQILDRLKKLKGDRGREGLSWVEVLPQLLDRLHDTPGQSGYSPYEILFGRERPTASLPYDPPRENEDALTFVERQKTIDAKVAQILNEMHEKEAQWVNRHRKPSPSFQVGQKVWYLRPEDSGTKVDSRWLGPCLVKGRIGEESYEVEVKPGRQIHTTARFLKAWQENTFGGPSLPLFFHQQTVIDEEADPTEWNVQEILGFKIVDGQKFFKVLWDGYPRDEATWEGIPAFLSKVNLPWRKFCERNGIVVDLIKDVHME